MNHSKRCNGNSDCLDGSDETDCGKSHTVCLTKLINNVNIRTCKMILARLIAIAKIKVYTSLLKIF